MFARHVTLGRVVIVIGGLLVLAALSSQVPPASRLFWGGVFAGGAAAFLAILLAGRTIGGWLAVRHGRDLQQGHRAGMQAAAVTMAVSIGIYRYLTAV